jgi:hypothetical protein
MALAGFLLGGCSGGSDAAKAAVKNATVESADLPADWTRSPAPDPVGTEGDDSRYSACIGRPDPKRVRTATSDSDEFRQGDATWVTSRTLTMPDESVAKADFDARRGDRAVPCLRNRFRNELDRRSVAGSAPQSVTVDRLPGLDFGDETVAFRATLTYPAGDTGPKTTYVDVVNVRKARVEIVVTLSSTQEPFPADLERDVVTRMVARI